VAAMWSRRLTRLPRGRQHMSMLVVTSGLVGLVLLPVVAQLSYHDATATPAPTVASPVGIGTAGIGTAGTGTAGTGTRLAGTAYQVLGRRPAVRATVTLGPGGFANATHTNTVALTFDDGPNPIWTPQVLEVLRQFGVKATFCLVGVLAQAYPALVRAIVADGHTLCNHTWRHNMRLGRLSRAAILDDLRRTNAAIHAAVPAAAIPYFRQPGGFWTPSVVATARELGMTSLGWTADTRDWSRPSLVRLVARLNAGCHPGSIILMHDGGGVRSSTVRALQRVLPALVRRCSFVALASGAGL
jgi:peptidoglycan-N-acetylglucosamine deacetylase